MNTKEQIDRFEFAIVLGEEMARGGPHRDEHGDILSWSPYRVAKLASDLISAHRRLHRMAEDNCNGFHTEAESDAHEAKVERARNRVSKMLAPYGITAVFRGLVLTLPRTKRTNGWDGWGNEGYHVPR